MLKCIKHVEKSTQFKNKNMKIIKEIAGGEIDQRGAWIAKWCWASAREAQGWRKFKGMCIWEIRGDVSKGLRAYGIEPNRVSKGRMKYHQIHFLFLFHVQLASSPLTFKNSTTTAACASPRRRGRRWSRMTIKTTKINL